LVKPVLLSTPKFSSWFPDIVTDPTGRVHVVWGSGILGVADKSLSKDYNTVVYTTGQDGQEWSKPIDLFAMVQQGGGDEATRPALFIDQRGVFHLTFRYTSVFYSHSSLDSVSSVESWPQPRQLSSFQNAYFSRLTGDGEGRLHLIFTEMFLARIVKFVSIYFIATPMTVV